MTDVLLLGAGFSRNWGGWLGDEVFEYLLGSPDIAKNPHLISYLWKNKNKGGFEYALAEIQQSARQNYSSKENLESFQAAILQMFWDMETAIGKETGFGQKLENFLARFDAVFTLNQDLLLEKNYDCGNAIKESTSGEKVYMQIPQKHPALWPHGWQYWQTPGVSHPRVRDGSVPSNKQLGETLWIWNAFHDALILEGRFLGNDIGCIGSTGVAYLLGMSRVCESSDSPQKGCHP